MDQQTRILNLHVSPPRESSSHNLRSSSSSTQKIAVDENHHMRTREAEEKRNLVVGKMSEEEVRVRGELEGEIEKDLEEEIKDGIYHLAVRLHRLYRHRRERTARDNRGVTEVKISTKMDGETRIEIKESKNKEGPENGSRPQTSRSDSVRELLVSDTKKVDWARSLRSGSGAVVANKKNNERSNQGVDNGRKNLMRQRKGNAGADKRALQLGWKW